MSPGLRLAALLAAVLAAACTSSSAPQAGAQLAEPSSVAVFRGVTIRSGLDPTAPSASSPFPYRPYLAVANAASNELSIIDGVDDTLIPAPAVVRGLVYPVPGRPVILAAGDLGDLKPDLLVVATAGDLPWLGGTQLRVIRTWAPDGAIVDRTDGAPAVNLGADVLGLLPLPPDPATPGKVTLVAALAGEQLAIVTFGRAPGTTAIDVDAAQATVRWSGPLGFQPLHLAAIPGERARVFAASTDPLPGGVQGVAQVALPAPLDPSPVFTVTALNAHAPTRLVAALRLAEANPFDPALDAAAFAGQSPVDRVFAVLDESGCGLQAAIGCGLVAIDPAVTRDLLPDPTPAGSMHAPFLAPIPFAYPLALGASGPPAVAPSPLEPQYAGTFLRVAMTSVTWQTTGVAGVATADGRMSYVDLARWAIPSNQPVLASAKATVTSVRPAGTAGGQFLTLVDPRSGATVDHASATGLTAAVGVTGGYTPFDRWVVTREGALPGLSARRAEAYSDGSLALQVTSGFNGTQAPQEVVRLWDPTLGVTAGDLVVIEPSGLGTCRTFEASVQALLAPAAASGGIPARPGGAVTLAPRTPTVPEWDRCLDAMRTATGATYLATFRAGGYVLLRGTGAAAVHVGRPVVGQRFEVAWQDEVALQARCLLPPAVRWQSSWSAAPPACDAGCRDACADLQRARLSRRIGYVHEAPAGATGPALAFTLAAALPTAPVPRDAALVLDTFDGRAPYVVAPTTGFPVDARAITIWDRSPWVDFAGPRFLVPYAGGVVLDSSPTLTTNGVYTIH